MAYTAMYEMWRTRVDGAPFDVLLDLGHGEDFPLSTHPWFFGVRIPMAQQDDNGFPIGEEAGRLDAVENRIREATRAREGLYVGRRTGVGNRDLLIYFPQRPRGIEDRIRASIGTELLFISRADPEWQGYQQLLPGPKDWRRIEDGKSITVLLDAGSDPSAEHLLEHAVETPSPKGAEAIKRLMEKLELENVVVEGARPDLMVRGTQRTAIDHDAILRVSWILESKSPKARGDYLGWTAAPAGDDDDDDSSDLIEAILANLDDVGLEDDVVDDDDG